MKKSPALSDTEKKIRDAMREGAPQTPPFADIAKRIAAGEPSESFGEFFAGEALPEQTPTAPGEKRLRLFRSKRLAIASAAALIVLIGGGIIFGAIFSESLYGTKYAADYSATAEENCAVCENEAADAETGAYDNEAQEVSDSDMKASQESESDESFEKD